MTLNLGGGIVAHQGTLQGRTTRLPGRLTAVFFAGAGLLALLTLAIRAGLDIPAMAVAGAAALGIGITVWAIWAAVRLEQAELALRRERDQARRLRELDDMKDQFLLSVFHELRNPITVCRGHLDILEDGAPEGEVREVKDILISELDLMTRLVEDLTTLELVDDVARLRLETLSLRRFTDRVVKQAEPLLGDRFRVAPDVPDGMLLVDPQRLSQALLNLLRNAAEHARGTGPVRFRVRADPAGCRFEVADEGGGLPGGEEEAVFEPFRTASSATGGTGLGLSVVQRIARAHGGEAGVDNRPGLGATFWIRIPR